MKHFVSTDRSEVRDFADRLHRSAGFPHPPDGHDPELTALAVASYWAADGDEREAMGLELAALGWTLGQAEIEEEYEPDSTKRRYLYPFADDVDETVLPLANRLNPRRLEALQLDDVRAKIKQAGARPANWKRPPSE